MPQNLSHKSAKHTARESRADILQISARLISMSLEYRKHETVSVIQPPERLAV